MAEELISTPQLTAEGPGDCATPESWEMRPEAQTPAQHLPTLTTNDQEETTPHLGNDGISSSFNGFMDYDMYETPPGAHLYRDQCAYDNFDMSYQDMDTPGKAESDSPKDSSPDRITSDMIQVPEGPPLQANKEGDDAMNKESSLQEEAQNHDEVALSTEVQNGHCYIEESADKCYKFGDSCLQRSFDASETDSRQHTPCIQHEVEECILERLDQQKYPEEDKLEGIAPIAASASYHQPSDNEHLTSPKIETLQDSEESELHFENSSLAVTEGQTAYEDKTGHSADYLNTSPRYAGKESKDERVEYQGEPEVQPQTSPSTSFVSENMNSSLMSMGAPQDAHELDQLADFLNMEDPFDKPVESLNNTNPDSLCMCTSQSKDIGFKESESIPMDEEKTASPSAPPEKKKRGRKVNTVSERRRSVRIARRESLFNTPCDIGHEHLHIVVANDTLPTYDQNITQEHVIASFQHESEDVLHPLPELGESSPQTCTLDCNELKTVDSGPIEGPTMMSLMMRVPDDATELEHVNIDLPMYQKKKKTKNGRRRSVRILEQNIQLEEDNQAVVQKPEADEKGNMCDTGFLADFADFGLGDNWMPGDMFGESQFAKTPKERSGRRKSARLSGVHIPLLELTDKSEVKVYGGMEEATYMDGPSVLIEDTHMPDNHNTALAVLAETTSMINVSKDVHESGYNMIESVTEFPFERQDAFQSSKKKRERCSKRRRSIRLVKKLEEQPKCDTDSRQENREVEPSKTKATKSYKRNKIVPGFLKDNVLQEVNIMKCDNTSKESQMDGELFTALKPHVEDSPMDLTDCHDYGVPSEVIDLQESAEKATSLSKDTPFMGKKKRVSRISEKDKENDDALQAQEQCHLKNTSSVGRKRKKKTPAEKVGDAEQGVGARQAKDGGIKGSVDRNLQITNKIKLMYLKKGAALKKHHLETIFESPKRRATGTPVNLLGARKMKRTVAFTETPWLEELEEQRAGKLRRENK